MVQVQGTTGWTSTLLTAPCRHHQPGCGSWIRWREAAQAFPAGVNLPLAFDGRSTRVHSAVPLSNFDSSRSLDHITGSSSCCIIWSEFFSRTVLIPLLPCSFYTAGLCTFGGEHGHAHIIVAMSACPTILPLAVVVVLGGLPCDGVCVK